jgi:hypothetical protein
MPPDGQTVRPFVINEKLHDVCSAAAGPMPRRLIVSLVAIAIRLRLIFSDNETERPYLFSMAIARMTIRCLRRRRLDRRSCIPSSSSTCGHN